MKRSAILILSLKKQASKKKRYTFKQKKGMVPMITFYPAKGNL